MIFGMLKYGFILLIAIPFLVMIVDVVFDVAKRFYGFYKTTVKHSLTTVFTSLLK